MFRKAISAIASILATCAESHATDIHRVVTGLDAND
jgi:hypothetical protein